MLYEYALRVYRDGTLADSVTLPPVSAGLVHEFRAGVPGRDHGSRVRGLGLACGVRARGTRGAPGAGATRPARVDVSLGSIESSWDRVGLRTLPGCDTTAKFRRGIM
jgi:hypothetical protein